MSVRGIAWLVGFTLSVMVWYVAAQGFAGVTAALQR